MQLMFSITPTTRTKLRRAMSAARWATFWAANAGVVTITMSARGKQARKAHLHVARARWHVDEQVVEVAPPHVAQELLDGLGEHQAAPHQRRVLADEEAGGDDLQAAGTDGELVRPDEPTAGLVVLDRLESFGHAEQAGDREAPDVGVEDADGATLARQGDGEVDGDGALADAALAAGDGQHPRRRRHLRVAGVLACVPARLEHHLAALLGGHLAPHDADVGDAGVDAEAALHLALDVGAIGQPPMVSLIVTVTTPSAATITDGTIPSVTMSAPSSGSTTVPSTASTSSRLGGGSVASAIAKYFNGLRRVISVL